MQQGLYISGARQDTTIEALRPSFEKADIHDVFLLCAAACNSGMHISNYGIGYYQGNLMGIIFGRDARTYEHTAAGLARLSHRSVPQCYGLGSISTDFGRFGYLLVQHFPGKTLKEHLNFSIGGRKEALSILIGIVDILDYIHSMNVIHNDITPEHVLVSDGLPRLIDFHLWGNARAPCTDFCGQGSYPDVVVGELTEHIRPIDSVPAWEPRSYGKMLQELVPNGDTSQFIEALRQLGNHLTGKSEHFVFHPKSRNYISNKIKRTLEGLASKI